MILKPGRSVIPLRTALGIFIALVLLIASDGPVLAQIPESGDGVLFGPVFYMGGSAATGTPPANLQSRIRLAWTMGAAVYNNITDNTLVGVELFYSKRAYDLAQRDNPDIYADLRLEYLGIAPFMRHHWFLFGIDLLYPMAAETNVTNADGATTVKEYKALDISIEARIGASFHLMGGNSGELRGTGFLTYPLLRSFLGWDPRDQGSTLPITAPIDGRLITLQVGLSCIIGSNN